MDAGAGAVVLDAAVGVETGVGLIAGAGAGAYAGAVALVCAYVKADAGAGQCTDAGTSARTSAVCGPDLGLVELLPPAAVGGFLVLATVIRGCEYQSSQVISIAYGATLFIVIHGVPSEQVLTRPSIIIQYFLNHPLPVKVGVCLKMYPCLFEAVAFVSDLIYGLNDLVQHPLIAFNSDLVDRGLLVGLLFRVEGSLALLGPLADRARSWAESVMNP